MKADSGMVLEELADRSYNPRIVNNLSDPLETLQREWPAIKSAPWAFGGALTVLTALAWGLIHWIYRTRLETRKDTIEHLEAQIERLSF